MTRPRTLQSPKHLFRWGDADTLHDYMILQIRFHVFVYLPLFSNVESMLLMRYEDAFLFNFGNCSASLPAVVQVCSFSNDFMSLFLIFDRLQQKLAPNSIDPEPSFSCFPASRFLHGFELIKEALWIHSGTMSVPIQVRQERPSDDSQNMLAPVSNTFAEFKLSSCKDFHNSLNTWLKRSGAKKEKY